MRKVAVFAVNGVFFKTEDMKREAYRRIFREYGEPVPEKEIQEAIDHFDTHRGDRYAIIARFLGAIGMSDQLDAYAARYGDIVESAMKEQTVEQAVFDVLDRLKAAGWALFVCSNTPDDKLAATLAAAGLAPYFNRVFGSSVAKDDILWAIAQGERVGFPDIHFVGSHAGDRAAARAVGCRFIGVPSEVNRWGSSDVDFSVMSLSAALETLLRA